MDKPITKSKTFWFNAVVVAVAALSAVLGTEVIQANPQTVAILTSVVAGLNIILRIFTSKSIS